MRPRINHILRNAEDLDGKVFLRFALPLGILTILVLKTDLTYTGSFRKKLSATFLAALIVFSLFAQAFHFIYHAEHYSASTHSDIVTVAKYEQSANCTLCDQMLHHGYSFLPAHACEIAAPFAMATQMDGCLQQACISRMVNSLTNKAPPVSFIFSVA